ARVLPLVVPLALLEANDPEPRLREPQCHDCARRAGTDDEDVRGFAGHYRVLRWQSPPPPAAYGKRFLRVRPNCSVVPYVLRTAPTLLVQARVGAVSRSRPTSVRTPARCARSASEIGRSGFRTCAASRTPRMHRHSLSRTR